MLCAIDGKRDYDNNKDSDHERGGKRRTKKRV